jgi:hypothetical protein
LFVVSVAIFGGIAATHAAGGSPHVIGRFQVVNPTHEFRGSTMLLDTATGETWMVCGGPKEPPSRWCKMRQCTFASDTEQ